LAQKHNIRVRWTPDREWLIVAHAARPLLAKGLTRFDALKKAQRVLPRSRQLDDNELKRRCYPSNKGLDHALEHLDAMSQEDLARLLPQAPQDPAQPAAPVPYIPRGATRWLHHEEPTRPKGERTSVTWEEIEWALLMRRVQYWQANGSTAGTVRLLQEAQIIELPPERRRPRAALGVNFGKYVAPKLTQAAREWLPLVESIPFDPAARQYQPVLDQPAPPPQEAAAPQPAPKSWRAIQSSPQEPPVALATPSQPTPAPTAAHDSARVFGISLANALVPLVEGMLAAHEATILARLREEQRAHGEQLAADMSRLLLNGLDRMLGGSPDAAGVVAGPQVLGEVEKPQAETPPAPPKLKVDVVGFEHGHHSMLVKQMLNGSSAKVDLRFVHPDHRNGYEPTSERHVILLTGRVSHTLQNKIRASGAPLHKVRRTVSDVVAAISNLVHLQAHR
jgi:hypothetical protein